MSTEKLLEIEHNMNKCKIDVFDEIKAIHKKLEEQDFIRKDMAEKLTKIDNKLIDHTDEEMLKYDEILVSIDLLTKTMNRLLEETSINTNFVSEQQKKEAIEAAITQHDIEKDKPMKDLKNKVMMTAVGIITAVAVSGLLGALWAGFKLYVAMGLG